MLQSRLEIDPVRLSSEIGLVWDGSRYHLFYFHREGSATPELVMRTIAPNGTVSPRTVISTVEPSISGPELLFEGSYLILAWHRSDKGEIQVEVRNPDDHSLIEEHRLSGEQPRLSINRKTGQGVLLYTSEGATWLREIDVL